MAGPGKPSESFPTAEDCISQKVEWEVWAHARMKDGGAVWISTSFANTGNQKTNNMNIIQQTVLRVVAGQ